MDKDSRRINEMYILSCTISRASKGLSVPEHTVTTRKARVPVWVRNLSRSSFKALWVIDL
jgi:hypothetical protein